MSLAQTAGRVLDRFDPPVLCLGGGGARGFANIGVLEHLDLGGVAPRAIAGTSMGALVGAMYLALGSARAVRARWQQAFDEGVVVPLAAVGEQDEEAEGGLSGLLRRVRSRVVITLAVNRQTMWDGEDLETAIEFLLPCLSIEELPRPFIAVATDLCDGSEVRIDSGDLRQAVHASAALPGLVPPVEIDGRLLIDGGSIAEVPTSAAKTLGRRVIAVDCSAALPPLKPTRNALDALLRSRHIATRRLLEHHLRGVGRVLRPEIGTIAWSHWHRFDEAITAGSEAAQAQL